jgi:phosphoglycerate dehydrogenase-like enzyme
MPVSVYYPNLGEDDLKDILRDSLRPDVRVIIGPAIPEPAEYEILVCGRPTSEQLDASPELHTLIIPWAGIPPETLEKVIERPSIAMNNLHYNAAETAEMALTLMLAAAKFILPMDRKLREGDWRPRYGPNPSLLLDGRNALLLGYGEIGQRMAGMCRGLNMSVQAVRRNPEKENTIEDVEVYPLDALHALLPQAQVLLISFPLTSETQGLIGERELALLPDEALLVNVGRGPIVDDAALYAALKSKALAGAGLDVWYQYPKDEASREETYPSTHPFHELENVVMSPHRAGGSRRRMLRRLTALAELLNAAANDDPMPNRVDITLGY